jgi:hypothetical protein
VALRRHFPAFADIPSSHSPASEVRGNYLVPLQNTVAARLGRFTLREAYELLPPWRRGPHLPRAAPEDLAFTALSTLGLARLGGGWREAHLRDRLHTLRAFALFGGGDIRRPLLARAQATRWLAQWGLAAAELDGRA